MEQEERLIELPDGAIGGHIGVVDIAADEEGVGLLRLHQLRQLTEEAVKLLLPPVAV